MQIADIKKLSEIIDISADLINIFKEAIPKSISMVKSEILSNSKLYYLIGNNSIKFLEDLLENESRIILKSMEIDNFKFLTKNLSRLYSIYINRGFQREFFKIENFSWSVALPSNMIRYGEEIKKLYFLINQNLENIVFYLDFLPPKYEHPKEYDDFIRNFLIRLLMGDNTEAEILIKTFLVDDERRERVYYSIFYPSIYMIRRLYDTGFIDESESYMAFSVLGKTLSSIYREKLHEKSLKCFSLYVPTENIIGERILNSYYKLESQIFSDILSWQGINSLSINVKEIINKDFNYENCIAFFWGVSPFNLQDFKHFAGILMAKSSTCRIFIFSEDLEYFKDLSDYGVLINDPKESLEVIKNV